MSGLSETSLRVELGARSYNILIGSDLLSRLGEVIAPFAKGRRLALVTDETVDGLYGDMARGALTDYEVTTIIRPAGEDQKSMAGLNAVLDGLFDAGLDRSDLVLALGGGVIGDLAGFAASIYKRGVPFMQIPTTLLAQVDSSVGGKTAINSPYGKNLIGAFYQPQMVIADMGVLSSLPMRHIKAGYAEIVKYGLLGDVEFFELLDAGLGERVLELSVSAVAEAVQRSCAAKAKIVAADEREAGQRALLNLGHSFAHAFELAAGYDGDLLHGEAVSAGMDMAFQFSARQGLCSPDASARVTTHLERLDMPTARDMGEYLGGTDALMTYLGQDKKNERGELTFILTRGIGQAFVQKNVSPAAVRDFLTEMKAQHV